MYCIGLLLVCSSKAAISFLSLHTIVRLVTIPCEMSTFIRKKQSIKILKVTIKYNNKIIIVIIRYTLK